MAVTSNFNWNEYDYSVISKEDYEQIWQDVKTEYFEGSPIESVPKLPKFLFPIIKENPDGKVPKYKYAGDGADDKIPFCDKISLYNQEDQINLRIFPEIGNAISYFPECKEENGLLIPVICGKWKKRTL